VTGALEDAAEAIRTLIEQGGVTKEPLAEIEQARAGVIEKVNVLRMSKRV
jgi:hypothetical protein